MGCGQSASKKESELLENGKVKKAVVEKKTSGKGKKEKMLSVEKIRLLLKDYMESEERIKELEMNNPLTVFYIKKSQLHLIDKKIEDRIKSINKLKRSMKSKSHTGIHSILESPAKQMDYLTLASPIKPISETRRSNPSVKNVLISLGNKKFTKNDHEVLAHTNKLEILSAELEMLHQEKVLIENDVAELFLTLTKLKEEYMKQDDILGELGIDEDQATGNDCEVPNELVELESQRITISETFERWKEAKNQLIETSAHFSSILKKLKEIGKNKSSLNSQQLEAQYEVGEEIRDSLVTIWQCLQNVKFYIGSILPYCSDPELVTLEKAMTYLFIDLKSEERRTHAEACYSAFQKRVVALLAWVDNTIELVITPAMNEKDDEIYKKVKQLSLIRIENIRKKFPTLEWDKLSSTSTNDTGNLTNNQSLDKKANTSNISTTKNNELLKLLDPVTKVIYNELDPEHLAGLPTDTKLFGIVVKTQITPPPSKVSGKGKNLDTSANVVSGNEKIRRVTRKASIDNLTHLIENTPIDSVINNSSTIEHQNHFHGMGNGMSVNGEVSMKNLSNGAAISIDPSQLV